MYICVALCGGRVAGNGRVEEGELRWKASAKRVAVQLPVAAEGGGHLGEGAGRQ